MIKKSLIFGILNTAIFLFFAQRGISEVDESAALLAAIQFPDNSLSLINDFLITGPIFSLCGRSIFFSRLFTFVGLNILYFLIVKELIKKNLIKNSWPAFAGSSFLYLFFCRNWILFPNYNIFSFAAIFLFILSIFYFQDQKKFLGLVLFSGSLLLSIVSKPQLFILIYLLGIFLVTKVQSKFNFQNKKALIIYPFFTICLPFFIYALIQIKNYKVDDYIFNLGSHTSLNGRGLFALKTFFFSCILYFLLKNNLGFKAPWQGQSILGLYILFLLLMVISILANKILWERWMLSFFILPCVFLILLNLKIKVFFSQSKKFFKIYFVLFLISPFLFSFLSNGGIMLPAFGCAVFWYLAALLIMKKNNFLLSKNALVLLVFTPYLCTLAATTNPIHQTSIWNQKNAFKILRTNGNVFLDHKQITKIEKIQKIKEKIQTSDYMLCIPRGDFINLVLGKKYFIRSSIYGDIQDYNNSLNAFIKFVPKILCKNLVFVVNKRKISKIFYQKIRETGRPVIEIDF